MDFAFAAGTLLLAGPSGSQTVSRTGELYKWNSREFGSCKLQIYQKTKSPPPEQNEQCVINDIPASNLFLVKGQAAIIFYFDWIAVALPTIWTAPVPKVLHAPATEMLHGN